MSRCKIVAVLFCVETEQVFCRESEKTWLHLNSQEMGHDHNRLYGRNKHASTAITTISISSSSASQVNTVWYINVQH